MNAEHEPFDDLLRELLQEAGPDKAPSNFTQAVMGQITAEQVVIRPPKPLVGRWGWVGIAASLAAAVVAGVSFTTPSTTSMFADGGGLSPALGGIAAAFSNFQVPTLLLVGMVAVLALFGLDRFLQSKAH